MPEQPQWSERTLDMPPQDPWAEHGTVPHGTPQPERPTVPHGTPRAYEPPAPPPPQAPFSQGRAQVSSPQPNRRFADHEPTGTGWPGTGSPQRPAMSWRWSELRRGGEWTSAAVLFAFVGWGIMAISNNGSLSTQAIVFVVTLIVAVGVFCLARVVGHLVLERWMGRTRRTARGSHLVTALFLVGVAIADLQQVQWVMDAVHWVTNQA
ncbi:DNA-directed RNA polymerase II [Actinoplanes sp. NPDC051411]|uniref:DNA-directed RNA polymerase II n=1 Tax=Actinoplanes sp. NPDC051411 TaxID=3155522 RepID=UPI0034428910